MNAEAYVGHPASIWRVVLVPEGSEYGRNGVLIADQDLVEFYDLRQDPVRFPQGQFVSRYTAKSFFAWKFGVNLYGGVPSWVITAEDVAEAQRQLKEQMA